MTTPHTLAKYAEAHGMVVIEIGPDYIICEDVTYDATTKETHIEPSERLHTLKALRDWLGY